MYDIVKDKQVKDELHMALIYKIIQYIPSMLECFILWRLLTTVMVPKYNKIVPAIAAVGMLLISILKSLLLEITGLQQFQIIGLMLPLIYTFFVFYFLSKNTFVEKLIWWGIYILGLLIVEMAAILLLRIAVKNPLDLISGSDPVGLWIAIIVKGLSLLLFEVVIRKRKGKIVIVISFFKELVIIIILNLLLILLVVFTVNNRHDIVNKIDDIIILFFGLVLLITSYTVALIFRIEKRSNEELETQLKLQQIEMELKLNNDMINVTDKLRKLRHDMTNHIGLIRTLARNQKYEEMEDYIDQIYEDVEVANDLVLTENKTLSVLLNAKKNLAKEKKIQFSSIIATQEINMQNKDICSLLGNILDNAIEAAETSAGKKFIELAIYKSDNGCVIKCENSFGVKPVMKKGRLITRKDDVLLHGLGTENIKDIVAKYHGDITYEYDDSIFGVHVIIPIENNN